MCDWRPGKQEEGLGVPNDGVTDGDEPPCGFWESKPGHLQKQQVFFTSEPSF